MDLQSYPSGAIDQGVVYKKNTGSYLVHTPSRIVPCGLSARLRKELVFAGGAGSAKRGPVRAVKPLDHADPVAIGDQVLFTPTPDGGGLITEVLPRRNQLSRRSAVPMPTAHAHEQVIVANVDQVTPVFALANPEPKWNMLDRYLVLAESLNLPVVICLTKLDLVRDTHNRVDAHIQAEIDEYQRIGYPVVLTSVVDGAGLDELRAVWQGRVSVLLGKSGVGKSSLLNSIQPGLGLRVNEVSQVTGKGKHTTTHLEMFPLEFGGAIVDTPGVREFGLWEVDADELAFFYPELRPHLGRCRFGMGCSHNEEPGCALRAAVLEGQVSPRRYQSYMRLKEEIA